MDNHLQNIIQTINETSNPAVKAQRITSYITDGFKNQKLNLYEAYLLHWEVIHNTRESYLLPAWNRSVQISTCLALLNQKLLALAFHDTNCAQQLEQWGMEAFALCAEKRAHYIMDRYRDFIMIDYDCEVLLKEMFAIREKYHTMRDSQGPYPIEVFPYHYFAPEQILLEKTDFSKEKVISEEVETILIALST